MSIGRRTLPDYDDPPVVETALGVEFETLEGWKIPHFGLFWNSIKNRYPRTQVHAPIPPADLRPEMKPAQQMRVELLLEPEIRCWFIDASDTRLLQVQSDRFIHNWRKAVPAEAYPHYETIRPQFESEWNHFLQFLEQNGFRKPNVRQCEVTYVNHLEKGKGWSSFSDLGDVISQWSNRGSTGFLPRPELVLLDARYPVSGDRGRLQIAVQPAIRHLDAKEVLQLTLTARCRPKTGDLADILAAVDLGREWVVNGFTDCTTQSMHKVWRRTQ